MNQRDGSIQASEELANNDQTVSPLTSEQRSFSEVVGREIARHWREVQERGQGEGGRRSQDCIQDKAGCISDPEGVASGVTASPV